jgi:hypothetical protein
MLAMLGINNFLITASLEWLFEMATRTLLLRSEYLAGGLLA